MAEFKIRAHITGNLWKIVVAEGQAVAEEDTLVIMESMKMEMPIESPVRKRIDAGLCGRPDMSMTRALWTISLRMSTCWGVCTSCMLLL